MWHFDLSVANNALDSDVIAAVADQVERTVQLRTFKLDVSSTKLRESGAQRLLTGITGHANLQVCKIAVDGCGIAGQVFVKLNEQIHYINSVVGPRRAMRDAEPEFRPSPPKSPQKALTRSATVQSK